MFIAIEVIYKRSGVTDMRYFLNESEFEEWFEREKLLYPDIRIISKREV